MNGLIKKVTIEWHDGTLIESTEVNRLEMTNVVEEDLRYEKPYRTYKSTGVTKWLLGIVCWPPLAPQEALGGSGKARNQIPSEFNGGWPA